MVGEVLNSVGSSGVWCVGWVGSVFGYRPESLRAVGKKRNSAARQRLEGA